jgi:hypothetical protein
LLALVLQLLTGDSREENNYREHIWEYTSAVVFVSMGVEIKSPPGNGPRCFRVHGQIYHLFLLLYVTEENKPGYRQVHTFDPAEATTKQFGNNQTKSVWSN